MQMRAGGLPMRAKDEHIPLSMGIIGQETCGAGGMAYGLRSCVDMIKAVHDIRRYAPDAWILNYSNPAAIVAQGIPRGQEAFKYLRPAGERGTFLQPSLKLQLGRPGPGILRTEPLRMVYPYV